jgi:hypothetical protein
LRTPASGRFGSAAGTRDGLPNWNAERCIMTRPPFATRVNLRPNAYEFEMTPSPAS